MTSLSASFDIPDDINDGLGTGRYERVGGVIRVTASKQVVAWLRENSLRHAINFGPALQWISPFIGVLNLGVSVGGFALVLGRLRDVETTLRSIQGTVSEINQKIDFGTYANFASAIQQAKSSFLMSNPQNRQSSAMQAIDRLLVAEHYLSSLFDQRIASNDSHIDGHELLSSLCLAYTAETLCYLELNEPQVALSRLTEIREELDERICKLCSHLLTLYDAPYLHPYILEKEDAALLNRIYSIYVNVYDDMTAQEMISVQNAKFIDRPSMYNAEKDWERFRANVLQFIGIMETKWEQESRLYSYQVEIEHLIETGISWKEWQDIKPNNPQQNKEYFLILAQTSSN